MFLFSLVIEAFARVDGAAKLLSVAYAAVLMQKGRNSLFIMLAALRACPSLDLYPNHGVASAPEHLVIPEARRAA